MADRVPGPATGFESGEGWIDDGTMCRVATPLPGPSGARSEPMLPSAALARGYLFIVFEQLPEVGAGKLVRKVAAMPASFPLTAANPLGTLSPAEHVLNLNPAQSQYHSASQRPFGAPTIEGKPLLLDTAKIRSAGGQVYSVAEVVADLERYSTQNPARRPMVERLIQTIRNIEGEVLIKGSIPRNAVGTPGPAHQAYIRSAEDLFRDTQAGRMTRAELEGQLAQLEHSYGKARIVGRVGRVLTVVGVVMSVNDLAQASRQSVEQRSFKPIGAESVRQVGGWGAAIAGGKIGLMAGAAVGIETGPGAILTGAIGAVIFGTAGYFGADWLADKISPN